MHSENRNLNDRIFAAYGERESALKRLEELITLATLQGRALTDAELAEMGALRASVERLTARIAQLEGEFAIRAANAVPVAR